MLTVIIDSHCHPQFPQYEKDREEIIQRALDGGVFMICVGTDLETSKQGIELAQKYNGMWATVGMHPNDAVSNFGPSSTESRRGWEFQISDFQKLLNNPKVVGVGEVGLDYYRTPEPEKQEIQKEVFKKFLDLAIKYDKPIVIHSRDAGKGSVGRVHKDVLEILESCKLKVKSSVQLRGVAHSFTGNIDEARKYLDLGFYLGFNGIITFTRQYDEVVKYVPLDRILLETDAPYLAPELYRGQRNEPLHVKEIASKTAGIKGVSVEKVMETTLENTKHLFGLNL